MINWDKLGNKKQYVLPVLCVILALVIFMYINILVKYINQNLYVEELEKIVKRSEDTIFAINKVYLCSSANAKDNSVEQNMTELNVYQYTDIAIYIENFKDEKGITNKNTVKELYIDNINIDVQNEDIGNQNLTYTNSEKFGKRDVDIDTNSYDRIDFNIVHTNKENEDANYTKPTFYTDCSNPITLKYVNNFENKYSIEMNKAVSFDGSILKEIGITEKDLNCKVRFKINIVNNENENYSCWFNFILPLKDIYNGTSIKKATINSQKYNFF